MLRIPGLHGALARYPGDATGPQRNLISYWSTGKGGKLRIRWGTDGAMRRCIKIMREPGHLPPQYDAGGFCANLHRKATGQWPTEGGKRGIPS